MASFTSSFSQYEYRTIDAVSRTSSVLSLFGSIFIITTFVSFAYFRKPINRLIFYATFGNLFVNIATLIATSALPQPGDTKVSGLCEFQGVLIQWFMSADAYWDFCMAINVLLVFFFGYNSRHLHQLERWYALFAYGVPAIPAITYVILDHTGHSIVGSATIWCWVNKENDWMRIAFFYAPVWLVIFATFAIYLKTGAHIFRKRMLLHDFHKAATRQPDLEFSPVVSETYRDPFLDLNNIVVTTDIGYAIDSEQEILAAASIRGNRSSTNSFPSTHILLEPSKTTNTALTLASTDSNAPRVHLNTSSKDEELALESQGATMQREYRATAFATGPLRLPTLSNVNTVPPTPSQNTRTHMVEGNEAAMAYLKVAMLMFIAIFMIWVPSTINRLYSFVHQGKPNYGLNLTSSIVLPLQGAWAAAIYAFTTRSECRRAYAETVAKVTAKKSQDITRLQTESTDSPTRFQFTRESQRNVGLGNIYKPRM